MGVLRNLRSFNFKDSTVTASGHDELTRMTWHMALAVPYCDIVVTERFWTRASEDTGLAQKYGTVVCAVLAELLDMLPSEVE